MKRIIQAMVLASLFTGAQAALAFPPSDDDVLRPAPVTRADRYADKGAPVFMFQESTDDVLRPARSTRVDRFSRGASDPALSQ